MASSDTFFQPVGTAAQAVDELPDSAASHDNDDTQPVQSIESLCLECGKNGITRLLLTSIPYFREVIVASFRCDHCGNTNNEVQSAGKIQDRGCTITVKITNAKDLDRSLVKSQYCSVTIPELELTIPPGRGQFTTVEGIVSSSITDLEFQQPVRKHSSPEVFEKIEHILKRLREFVRDVDSEGNKGMEPFTIQLEDPAGNSFIESIGGLEDRNWTKKEFTRSSEQNSTLGLASELTNTVTNKTLTDDYQGENPETIHSFPSTCTSCGGALETLMKSVDIPHFKEVILMSTNCGSCGYRDNEIKSGGAISTHGRKLTLKVEDSEDLSRDILKSETASLSIPEIELYLNPGTLGGRFTTLEGLLEQIYKELDERAFARGDANARGSDDPMTMFLAKLKQATTVDIKYTVILDDPVANSYIQNLYAPDPDPNLTSEDYERTFEQQEDLGLNDMVTENYADNSDQ